MIRTSSDAKGMGRLTLGQVSSFSHQMKTSGSLLWTREENDTGPAEAELGNLGPVSEVHGP